MHPAAANRKRPSLLRRLTRSRTNPSGVQRPPRLVLRFAVSTAVLLSIGAFIILIFVRRIKDPSCCLIALSSRPDVRYSNLSAVAASVRSACTIGTVHAARAAIPITTQASGCESRVGSSRLQGDREPGPYIRLARHSNGPAQGRHHILANGKPHAVAGNLLGVESLEGLKNNAGVL